MQEKVTQQSLRRLSASRGPVGHATSSDTTSRTKRREISQNKAHLQRLDLVRRHVSHCTVLAEAHQACAAMQRCAAKMNDKALESMRITPMHCDDAADKRTNEKQIDGVIVRLRSCIRLTQTPRELHLGGFERPEETLAGIMPS